MSALAVICPKCAASAHVPCSGPSGRQLKRPHKERKAPPARAPWPGGGRVVGWYSPNQKRDDADREVALEDARAFLDGRGGDPADIIAALVGALNDSVSPAAHDEVVRDLGADVAKSDQEAAEARLETDRLEALAEDLRGRLRDAEARYEAAVRDAASVRGLLLDAERQLRNARRECQDPACLLPPEHGGACEREVYTR